MGWFNAGTDELIESPEVMGTIQLPLPVQCFGRAECNYGTLERQAFLEHILNEFQQASPWPTLLTKSFSPLAEDTPSELKYLLGSPFLDTIFGVGKVKKRMSSVFKIKVSPNSNDVHEMQYDTMLPPEITHCSWALCSKCRKWRRVAWYVNPDELPDVWSCEMNYWDIEKSNCSVESDYDPEVVFKLFKLYIALVCLTDE